MSEATRGLVDRARTVLARTPLLRVYLLPQRLRTALDYARRPLTHVPAWLWRSNETENFTYDLAPLNRQHLAWFVSAVTGCPVEQAAGYIEELDGDEALRAHLRTAVEASDLRWVSDLESRYARRVGWYAIVRAAKPRVVVETGVDKGLGSCVLAAALLRNRAEGRPGITYGTDIRPEAGFLLGGPYAEVARTLIGDSIESLRALDERIDLFVNDSDHSATYEYEEYRTIADKLSPGALVLGDNAHVSDSLMRFARETGRAFLYFQEHPAGHWYPGAGIGVAYPRRS